MKVNKGNKKRRKMEKTGENGRKREIEKNTTKGEKNRLARTFALAR